MNTPHPPGCSCPECLLTVPRPWVRGPRELAARRRAGKRLALILAEFELRRRDRSADEACRIWRFNHDERLPRERPLFNTRSDSSLDARLARRDVLEERRDARSRRKKQVEKSS